MVDSTSISSKEKKTKRPSKEKRKASGSESLRERARKDRNAPFADFPIVVVGASAGGLDAFRKLLAAMPPDSGIATVLVPHLDPTHQSLMPELLAKTTSMPVREARHGTAIRPNRVYVIPPNRYLAIKDGKLALSQPPRPQGRQTAIDFALGSTARDQREAAIGIVLSGTGSHGTLGVKEIKLAGGLVLVQDPATAEFDQMPRSALATGVVDHVLPPEKMPEVLLRYARDWHRLPQPESEPTDDALDGLNRVLAVLQSRTKHDVRHYRKNMIARRIRRRMTLLQIPDWDDYVDHLCDNEDEVEALFRDLLIGVTSFFRDPQAFEALAERVLPELVARATAEHPVRVWVPGCASGEEAYSIAMLLFEQFGAAGKTPSLQIFASDVGERSLETARQGIYPESIASTLSADRLRRFFVKLDAEHYQVSKPLRDSVVFALQNLISDAPFSKLDLISCRNVLIYLEPEVQEKVVSLLHFALNDDGYLLLGPSESIGRTAGMFEPIVKKWRLFRRIGPVRRDLVTIPIAGDERRRLAAAPERARAAPSAFTQLLQKLLAEDFAPASALINRNYEILSVQGPLVNYLEFPPGEMTTDLLALARHGLRTRIRSACRQALREGHTVSETDARVRRNGGYVHCTVTARSLTQPKDAEGLLLVVFQDRPAPPAGPPAHAERHDEESPIVVQLENELRATREDLQTTIGELESSNEELKASNEEIMSMNEELQSANEELETSKEELQSLNEELAATNSQLQEKVEDLDAANSDLTNLMAATDIATVFLDTELRIKRFTPRMARLFNLLAADVGRPIRDLAPRFTDDDLLSDAGRVLDSLTPREKAIRTDQDHWYLRRISPYRTLDDRIGGVVISFIDITARTAAEAQARRLAGVLHDSRDAIILATPEGRITAWNRGAAQAYGYSESDALDMNMHEITPEPQRQKVAEIVARAARGEEIGPFESQRLTREGRVLDVWVTLAALKDDKGRIVALARTERDITARRAAEAEILKLNADLEQRVAQRTAALADSEHRIRAIVGAAVDAIITIDQDGVIETFNTAAETMFGYAAAEAIGRNVSMLMGAPHRERHDDYLKRYARTHEKRVIGRHREFRARRKDGTEFPIQLSVSAIPEAGLFTGVVRDMTEQRRLQEEIVGIATLEQRRIGEELHDTTQQELTGLGLLAQNLADALHGRQTAREQELADRLAAGIATTNAHVRELARGLVPVPVDAEGLMAALAALAQRSRDEHRLRCEFVCPEPVRVTDDGVALHLYRIAQEAVTNAIKHAGAETISIRLRCEDGALEVEIRDDGVGIDPDRKNRRGLGLRIMEHRCGLIGGTFSARRHASGGTLVSCKVPLA